MPPTQGTPLCNSLIVGRRSSAPLSSRALSKPHPTSLLQTSGKAARCFIYHNMELALEWEETQRAAMYDPTKADYFLQYTDGMGHKNGTIYNGQSGKHNLSRLPRWCWCSCVSVLCWMRSSVGKRCWLVLSMTSKTPLFLCAPHGCNYHALS